MNPILNMLKLKIKYMHHLGPVLCIGLTEVTALGPQFFCNFDIITNIKSKSYFVIYKDSLQEINY